MLSLHKHNWQDYNIDYIIGAKDSDGVRLLQLFLIDYKKEFHVEKVNPSCRRCLNDYLKEYKSKFKIMDSTCKYVLHKKREGIQLGFGSSIFVNNKNITDSYAKKLIEKFKKAKGDSFELSYLFSKFPKEDIKVISEEVKPKRKRKSKK